VGNDPAPRTLQRSRTLINGAEVEIVEVQLPAASDDGGGAASGVIEKIALIAGDGGMTYSIALRCAPQELARLEPLFQQAAQSWHLQAAAAETPAANPTPQPESRPQANPEKP
jgi:hypothetical protein